MGVLAQRAFFVTGEGNAALFAAMAAAEGGAEVLVLERAPETESGGNTRFTAGGMRCTYAGAGDLRRLMPDCTDEEAARTDFGSYPAAAFSDAMFRLTRYRPAGPPCARLVAGSRPEGRRGGAGCVRT